METPEDRKRVAALLRDHLARERLSREEFAFRTKLGKSTVDKLLTGLFSDRTLAVVEARTGLTLRGTLGAPGPPEGPSLAVLPFANLTGDPAEDPLCDGIAEDITIALSRLRGGFLIAGNSVQGFKGKPVDLRQAGQELGVRYLLEGSVRSAPGRLRVSAQLVEAQSGRHVWATRYDRERRDIFAVQDDIAESVAAAIEPELYAQEGKLAARRQPGSVDAWGLTMRAIGLVPKVGREGNEAARALLEQAIALDPLHARAHAVLAWATWWAAQCYWLPDRQAGFEAAAERAARAVALDPAEPWARMAFGFCLGHVGQHERALVELRSALQLNPNFALARATHGWALLLAGHFEEAIAETGRALRMSPLDSFAGIYTSFHGLALLGAGRFEEALPPLRAAFATFGGNSGHCNALISCCGHLGLLDEARRVTEARNRIGPELRVGVLRRTLAGFAHRDVFVEGLVKAGVPE